MEESGIKWKRRIFTFTLKSESVNSITLEPRLLGLLGGVSQESDKVI